MPAMTPMTPGAAHKKPARLDGRRFAIGFVVLLLVILAAAFGLRAKRIRDWNAAGGSNVIEGVTLPVRHR
jgi:hypothetical protein